MSKHLLTAVCLVVMLGSSAQAGPRYTGSFTWMPEFSGCFARASETGTFWVCSDERKSSDSVSRNEIWRFDAATGTCTGTNVFSPLELNDMECMTADGAGGYFIATSQSLTSGLEEKKSRNRLAHFLADGTLDGTVEDLRGKMIRAFPFLRNYTSLPAKTGGIDVEGIAYDHRNNRLWIGLRGPQVDAEEPSKPGKHAVLLTMTNVLLNGRINPSPLLTAPPQFLALGGMGIRDLFFDDEAGRLFLLAGDIAANEKTADGKGDNVTSAPPILLMSYDVATGKAMRHSELPQVPHDLVGAMTLSSAEGLCAISLSGKRKLLIVYDSKANGIYQTADLP